MPLTAPQNRAYRAFIKARAREEGFPTLTRLAQFVGITPHTLNTHIALASGNYNAKENHWNRQALAIAEALMATPEELFGGPNNFDTAMDNLVQSEREREHDGLAITIEREQGEFAELLDSQKNDPRRSGVNAQQPALPHVSFLVAGTFNPGPQPDEAFDNAARQQNVSRALMAHLTAREERIIRLRFGIGTQSQDRTLEEVADMLYTTRERVRQIEAKALRKLQRAAYNGSDVMWDLCEPHPIHKARLRCAL